MQITLEFSDGSIGSIAYLANGNKSFPKERVEVFCAGKVAVLDDFRRLELVSSGGKKTYRSPFRQDKGHQAAWAAFVNTLQNGTEAPIPYAQLMAVSKTAILAGKAAAEKTKIEIEK